MRIKGLIGSVHPQGIYNWYDKQTIRYKISAADIDQNKYIVFSNCSWIPNFEPYYYKLFFQENKIKTGRPLFNISVLLKEGFSEKKSILLTGYEILLAKLLQQRSEIMSIIGIDESDKLYNLLSAGKNIYLFFWRGKLTVYDQINFSSWDVYSSWNVNIAYLKSGLEIVSLGILTDLIS